MHVLKAYSTENEFIEKLKIIVLKFNLFRKKIKIKKNFRKKYWLNSVSCSDIII